MTRNGQISMMAVVASLGLAIAACAMRDDPELSETQFEEIGVCGANADPVSGVICKYVNYNISDNANPPFAGSELFEVDGIDYARCKWAVPCSSPGTPMSVGNDVCVGVLGTGCAARSTVRMLVKELKLPAGTQPDGVDAACQKELTIRNATASREACETFSDSVEQLEDQCCLPRPPPPPPAPTPGCDEGCHGAPRDARRSTVLTSQLPRECPAQRRSM
jgi:hypothetical protein